MPRFALPAALVALVLTPLAAPPIQAERSTNRLDTHGKPFGTAWSTLGRFDGVIATGADDFSIRTGDSWRIRATGDARALSQMRFLLEKDALIVGRISNQRERYGKVRVEITAPRLSDATAAGSGTVQIERLSGPRAKVTVAGSGRTEVTRVEADRASATIAGSGTLTMAGRSTRSDVTIAGSGGLNAADLTTSSADVTIAGSGTARLRATGDVSATIMGSGTATVIGTTKCRQTRMGSGRLICSN